MCPSIRTLRLLLALALVLVTPLVSTSVGALPGPGDRAASPAGLDQFIETRMRAAHLPGMQAVIVKGGRVVWEGAYGYANVEAQKRVSPETLFMLASISKTVTATALVQLADAGRLDLDADISALLPYPVVHPNAPTVPITARHLLTHTAGIEDNWTYLSYHPGDCPIPLGFFCAEYFTFGGRFHNVNANWHPTAPGTAFSYSNAGFAMVGNLVQAAAFMDFEDYCQANIFAPLGMHEASFRISKLDPTHVAHPYIWNGAGYVDQGFYGYPDYPDGTLRTSATQLARFAMAHMAGGGPLLSPVAAADMKRVQLPSVEPTQGLGFYYDYKPGRPAPLRLGHNGGDAGVQTDLWMCPWDDQTAVIVLANGDSGYQEQAEIIDRLFAEARGL